MSACPRVRSRADVCLLDDVMSAVDAHVGSALMEQCIKGALGRATRILVTNALQYLPQADLVVVMKGGRMVEAGSYAALQAKGTEFADLMTTHEVGHDDEEDGGATDGAHGNGVSADGAARKASLDGRKRSVDGRGKSLDGRKPSVDGRKASTDGKAPPTTTATTPSSPPAKPAAPVDENNLTGTEERGAGSIPWAIYWFYAAASGSAALCLGLVALGFCADYGSKAFLDAWLARFSEHSACCFHLLAAVACRLLHEAYWSFRPDACPHPCVFVRVSHDIF